jgi:SOS response regulatory protein OraA/RecX
LQYLNDTSFSSRWAYNLAVNKLWGNKKISMNLKKKGVALHIIEKAIEEVRQEIPEEKAITEFINKNISGGDKGALLENN